MTDTRNGKARILVVDDDQGITSVFGRLLTAAGYDVTVAHDGEAALQVVGEVRPDAILLDIMMPRINGLEVCRRLKQDRATRLTPVVLITAVDAREARIEGRQSGADDFLMKPVDSHEMLARVAALVRLKRYTDDLDSATSIISTLAVMIEARDGYTEGHCHRIANYATALGRAVGLSEEDVQTLHRGGFLHDIGMLAIPDDVLRKKGALEPEEYELIKSHTVVGDGLCANLRSLQTVRPIVRHHHERLDGSGYPDGLKGDRIPLVAQIIGLVDAFDAVTTQRPYQDARPLDEAVDVLREQVRRGWRSADLVEQFAGIVQSGRLDRFAAGDARAAYS